MQTPIVGDLIHFNVGGSTRKAIVLALESRALNPGGEEDMIFILWCDGGTGPRPRMYGIDWDWMPAGANPAWVKVYTPSGMPTFRVLESANE